MQEGTRTRWRHKWHDKTPWTCCQETLLELFNESWKNGTVPALWKKATIIPIHKKGKDKKDPNSYCPISLLSCLGKVLERVINRRLISFLEERKILSPTQTGYRKHRSTEAGPHCPRDRERLPRKEKGCLCFLWPNKSFWQSLARRSPAEDTWERRFWKNVQMDPMLPTRQIGQSKTGWPFEQKCKNARRSPTGRSHLTDTLSPVHQQHHDCASPTCLQHPTCRWSRRLERIWIHHILCLQNPGSCEQGRAVDKWLRSSDQWSEDSGHSFLPFHLQRKSRHKGWRQDTAPSGDSHLSRGKAWHLTLMEATHRGHGEKRHQEACCPEEIVWNTLGCQLQDSKNRLHGSCPAFSGIWGQRLSNSCQNAHQQTGQSSEHRLEDNPWRHKNHSYSWNGEDRWSWTTWRQETGQTSYPCRKDEEDVRPPPAPKAQRPHKKQIEKEKSEPPSKRTAEGTRRHPYNWWTPVWKTDFKQLATRNPTCWDQNNHSWHHYKGKPKWSSFEGSGSGRDWQALSSSNLDTHLHQWLSWKCHKKRRLWRLHQAPKQASIICVSTWWDTVLKLQSWSPSTGKRNPRKQSSSQTHYQPCKPSCLMSLTQRKRSSQRTSTPLLKLPM